MTSKQHLMNVWSLPAMWIVANLVGWVTGLTAGVLLTQVATAIPGVNEDRFVVYAILFATGLAMGIAQSRVMVGYLPRAIWWAGATFAGFLLCLIVIAGGNALRFATTGLWDDVLLLMLLGIAIGIPQWLILRQHYRNAWVWVPAMAAGFLVFLWTVANPAHSMSDFILLGAIEGTLASAVSGATLTWLVRQPLVVSQ